MNRLAGSIALVLAGGLGAEAAEFGPDETSSWRIQALSTLEYGRYEASGDLRQGPYRFLGGQGFGQLDLNGEWQPDELRLLRAQFRGVGNGSDYRSPFDGVVIERLNLRLEDGGAPAPLLLEVGDTFAYFSYRTLYRPLKGAQFEIQPDLGPGRRTASLQFVLGSYASSWRSLDFDQDLSAATSWLLEDHDLGRWSLSWVYHLGRAIVDGGERPSQQVFSLAGEKILRLGNERLRIEGELGRLAGNPAAQLSAVAQPADDERGRNGLFLQLGGRGHTPLSYRFRFESYGQEFRPAGGAIYPDRRSAEAHLAWSFPRGAELRGRYQHYRDFRETANPADTSTLGLAYTGKLPGWSRGPIATSAELLLQNLDSRDRALDARLWTLQAEAYGASALGITPRLRLFAQERDDRTLRDADAHTFQAELSGDAPLRWGEFRGTLSPGLVLRNVLNGGVTSKEIHPTFSFPIYRGRHSLLQSLGYLSQQRQEDSAPDVTTLVYRLLYRYALDRDVLSFELDTQGRHPEAAEGTTSLRAVVSWTHRLERSSRSLAPPLGEGAESIGGGSSDIAELRPGSAFDASVERLRRGGLGAGSRMGSLVVFETRLLPELEQRQRVVLVERDKRLEKAALVIDVGAADDTGLLERSFARARDILIARYGRPSAFLETGEVGDDTLAGGLVRIVEWYRPGAILRFGIPRRLDGQVRMELQLAEEFPSAGDPHWSIEELR